MATEFNDSQHYGFFMTGTTLTSGTGKYLRQSELTLAALRAAGFLDNMVDGTIPPTTDKLWLDKNTDPAVLKEYNPIGAAWQQVTSQTLFGRVPWRGEWESSPIYRRADVVSYQGAIWIAVQPSQNHPPAEDAYWDLFLESVADESVTTSKLVDGSVTEPKLADGAVSEGKLDANLQSRLPALVADTMLVDNAAGTARESKTFDEVKTLWDPSAKMLWGQGFLDIYYKAKAAPHISAYGPEGTIGVGDADADTAALQAALNTTKIVDITGVTLHINAKLTVSISGANIVSFTAARVGANAGSKIVVDNDSLDKLFDIQAPNFEASGFFIECSSANVTTTLFHFQRPIGSPSDIDAALRSIGHEGGGKLFDHFGRGLKLFDITSGNVKICVGDLNPLTPGEWTPNGQTNDLQETAWRGYEFDVVRMHGATSGIRNIGPNRKNIRVIRLANVTCDIGVGVGAFVGFAGPGSQFSNISSNIGATIGGGLIDLWEGSNGVTIENCAGVGIKTGSVTRLNRTYIVLRPTAADPIFDITINSCQIGPCNRSGILIIGSGQCYVSITGTNFDRTNIENSIHSPIRVEESGGTFSDVWVKLSGCGFRFGSELAPAYIINGFDSANLHVRIDPTTTKPSAIPWAPDLVDAKGATLVDV